LAVAGDAMRQTADGLDAEDGLWLGGEGEGCLKGRGDAMRGEEGEKGGWVCRVEV
jgi:hypothetical protein